MRAAEARFLNGVEGLGGDSSGHIVRLFKVFASAKIDRETSGSIGWIPTSGRVVIGWEVVVSNSFGAPGVVYCIGSGSRTSNFHKLPFRSLA
jgi:hypothetical protein